MAKALFILNDPPYGTERDYNALCLAASLPRRAGEEVKVFHMGDAATGSKGGQKVPQGYYNVEVMLRLDAVGRPHAGLLIQPGVCQEVM
jgi:uncharacterized protein involved in oxidation of intracellular sulfur